MKKVILLLVMSLIVFGCAERKVSTDADVVSAGEKTKTEQTQAAEAQKMEEEKAAMEAEEAKKAEGMDPVMSSDVKPEDMAHQMGGEMADPAESKYAPAPTFVAGKTILDVSFANIQFDFDMYDIKPEYKTPLMTVSDWLIRNEAVILIEGHCDDRGTNEYNLALGDRRAKSTRDYLMASGVPSRKIEYISYGEERPLCEEQTEDCWAKNRRAHFLVGTK